MLSQGQSGWILLFMLSIFLIIIGIQGSLGVTFAILFCPKYVVLDDTF